MGMTPSRYWRYFPALTPKCSFSSVADGKPLRQAVHVRGVLLGTLEYVGVNHPGRLRHQHRRSGRPEDQTRLGEGPSGMCFALASNRPNTLANRLGQDCRDHLIQADAFAPGECGDLRVKRARNALHPFAAGQSLFVGAEGRGSDPPRSIESSIQRCIVSSRRANASATVSPCKKIHPGSSTTRATMSPSSLPPPTAACTGVERFLQLSFHSP